MRTVKFKSSEVGLIPEEWDTCRIGDVSELSAAGDLQVDCSVHVKNALYAYPIYSNSLENAGLYGYTSNPRYKRDAVTITGRGTLGHAEYRYEDFDAIIRLIVLRPSKRLDGRYTTLQINFQKPFHFEITSIPQLTVPQVANAIIPIPPRPEQERIAEALSDVDELLAAMTTLIEKKRAIKQGAMQQLLTGKERLAGFTGPWVEKRFDDCFELISNNTFSREFMCHDATGIANIHYGDVLIKYGSVLDFSKEQVDSLTSSLLIKSEDLKDGDLIIADTAEDETVGKAVEIQHLGTRQAVAGLHTIACRPTMEFALGWLGYYINSSAFHNQLLPLISGTKVSSISKAGLRTTVLTIPTFAEQKAIAAVLSDMDAEIAALEAKRAKYESVKQGMMQELLTGKVRLV